MSWTDSVGTIIDVAHSFAKHGARNGSDAAGTILIQKSIATNGHLHLCTFDKIDGWIELLEFVKPIADGENGQSN